jgi:hypothetical protein
MPSVTDVAATPGALAVLAAAPDPPEPATVVPVAAVPDLLLLLHAVTANATTTPSETAYRPRTTTLPITRRTDDPSARDYTESLAQQSRGGIAITIISFSKAIAGTSEGCSCGFSAPHHAPGPV